MGNAGSGPRRIGWRRIRGVLLAPRALLIVVASVVAVIGIFVGLSAVYDVIGIHINAKLTAFVMGFLLAAFLGAVWYVAAVYTGGARWLMGASAERWTEKELVALGSECRLFHDVPFANGVGSATTQVDVDHVVVGPHGVLVVETKYSSEALDLGADPIPKQLRDAVTRARNNAGRINALLQRDAPGVPVRPVVVYWGRLVKPPSVPLRQIDEVGVVSGSDAANWLPLLSSEHDVPRELVDRAVRKVERYLSQ